MQSLVDAAGRPDSLTTGNVTLSRALPILVVSFGVIVAVMHRNPALFFHPRMMAEDVFVFFNEDRLFGTRAFFEPYAGYFTFVPRVVAFITGFAPPQYAPACYSFIFVAIILATAALIYTSPSFRGWSKALAALSVVISPTGSETVVAMSWVIWIIAPMTALALYETPTSRSRAWLMLTCYTAVGLSTPFVVIAAPFALLKLITERTRYAVSLTAVTAAIAILQLQGLIGRAVAGRTSTISIDHILIAKSILYSWLTGSRYPGFVAASLLSFAVLGLGAWYVVANWQSARRATIYFVAYGFAILQAGCSQLPAGYHETPFEMGARYYYPTVVLLVLAFIAIEQHFERRRITLSLCAVFLVCIQLFRVPSIDNQLLDQNWPATASCLNTSENCISVLNPPGIGATRVPSDSELAKMSLSDRYQFRVNQRVP